MHLLRLQQSVPRPSLNIFGNNWVNRNSVAQNSSKCALPYRGTLYFVNTHFLTKIVS